MKKSFFIIFLLCLFSSLSIVYNKAEAKPKHKIQSVLNADDFKHYVDYFNRMEDENIAQAIPNAQSWEWMKANIPLFECPQDNFEEMFYFRWWTLRKHIKETPVGYAFTEFLVERSYADRYNLIACAVGHHIYESRWLHNQDYLNQYIHVWYRGHDSDPRVVDGGNPLIKLHKFSNYTPYAMWERYKVNGDKDYLLDMYPDWDNEYKRWEQERRLPNGLFWQADVKDGMEEMISGGRHVKNARPTINSYMYGNAIALSKMAEMKNDKEKAAFYAAKADTLKQLVEENLWSNESHFFETLKEDGEFAKVREPIGYLPWMVNLPDEGKGYEVAWKQLMDPQGFLAPYGITTAEQRHPEFRTHGCCKCEWDGAIWPFTTSQTLMALENVLNNYDQDVITDSAFFRHMELYVESSYHRGRPYIGEYLDETTGYWLKGDQERSRYYNHSTFNDLIITGIVGLQPREDNTIEVHPLIPEGKWDWFCLDNVLYHNQILTIVWDKDGSKYNKGKGLLLFVDGKVVAQSPTLSKITYTPGN